MVTCYLLTGDIGGTNSRMSLYAADGGAGGEALCVKYYRNATDLLGSGGATPDPCADPALFQKRIVSPFLKHCWDTLRPDKVAPLHESEIIACLATAGVVSNNAVRITNLGGVLVDGTAMERDKSDEYLRRVSVCRIINDFVAQGYGCLALTSADVRHLHGPKLPGLGAGGGGSSSVPSPPTRLGTSTTSTTPGPKACVGAGTGLGECYLTPDPETHRYTCFPSEGGHVEYAPRHELEVKLWQHLMAKFSSRDRVSVERVVSGIGLANVYEFLAQEFPHRIDAQVHAEFEQAGDEQGRVVGEQSNVEGSLCRQAMDILMGAYGCEVGSAALKWIPTSGLFVTGGLTPKNLHFMVGSDSEFMQAYLHKGRVSPVLEQIPLYAVTTDDLGVRGAHQAAQILYEQHRGGGAASSSSSSGGTSLSKPSPAVLWAATAAMGFAAGLWLAAARRRW